MSGTAKTPSGNGSKIFTNQWFTILHLSNGETITAELMSVEEVAGKSYALLAIEGDDGLYDIMAAYAVFDENKHLSLEEIDSARDRLVIEKYLVNQMNEMIENQIAEDRLRRLDKLDEIIEILDRLEL